MLPDNTNSSIALPGLFLSPDSWITTPLSDFEYGGVALNDASQGLMVKVWHCWLDQYNVWIQAEDGEPVLLFQEVNLTEISLCFDQNMRWSVAYIQEGILKLRWYDSLVAGYVTTVFTEARTPKLSLDDKRPMHLDTSDMILAYMRGTSLYYRQQRERFAVERLLRDNLYPNTKLKNIGMSNKLRLQFELV